MKISPPNPPHCARVSFRFLACVTALCSGLSQAEANGAEPAAAAASDRAAFFETTRVHTIRLQLTPEEYKAIQPQSSGFKLPKISLFSSRKNEPPPPPRDQHRNMFGIDLTWGKGAVQVDDESFPDVGIRYKGNGTIFDSEKTIKKSFKIDLDRQAATKRLVGAKAINLHCGVADPSKLRETFAYALYRQARVPAPRTTFAEVWLSVPEKFENVPLGAYTIVEEIDRQFLREWFADDDGLLLKPEGLRDFTDRGDVWSSYEKEYRAKRTPRPDEAARLIAFARLVEKADDETFAREINSFIDLDAYFRFLAVTAFQSNADSFFALGHNYYLYLSKKSGRLHFFPWDVDRSFGNFPIINTGAWWSDLSMTRPYLGSHRLTERLLALPGAKQRYWELLTELQEGCLKQMALLEQLESLQTATKPLVDRNTQFAAERRKKKLEVTVVNLLDQAPSLRDVIAKRSASLAKQMEEAMRDPR